MSEFAKFLEMVSDIEVEVSTDLFVHYSEETGILQKIDTSSETDTGVECITVLEKEVTDIMNGKSSMQDYRVLFDSEKKRYVLKHTTMSQEMFNPGVGRLYEIKSSTDPDLTITKNLKTKNWVIDLDPKAVKFIVSDPAYQNTKLQFHITEEGDPNILYRYFEVETKQLISEKVYVPIKHKEEYEYCSVFTTKFFDEYNYKVTK